MNNNETSLKRFWFLWGAIILFLGNEFAGYVPDIYAYFVKENQAHQQAIVQDDLTEQKQQLQFKNKVYIYTNDKTPHAFFVVPQSIGQMNVGLAHLDLLKYKLTVEANGHALQQTVNINEITRKKLLFIEVFDQANDEQILTQSMQDMPISSVRGSHHNWTIALDGNESLKQQLSSQKIMDTILRGSNASKIYLMSSDYYDVNAKDFKMAIEQFNNIAETNHINTKLFHHHQMQNVAMIESF